MLNLMNILAPVAPQQENSPSDSLDTELSDQSARPFGEWLKDTCGQQQRGFTRLPQTTSEVAEGLEEDVAARDFELLGSLLDQMLLDEEESPELWDIGSRIRLQEFEFAHMSEWSEPCSQNPPDTEVLAPLEDQPSAVDGFSAEEHAISPDPTPDSEIIAPLEGQPSVAGGSSDEGHSVSTDPAPDTEVRPTAVADDVIAPNPPDAEVRPATEVIAPLVGQPSVAGGLPAEGHAISIDTAPDVEVRPTAVADDGIAPNAPDAEVWPAAVKADVITPQAPDAEVWPTAVADDVIAPNAPDAEVRPAAVKADVITPNTPDAKGRPAAVADDGIAPNAPDAEVWPTAVADDVIAPNAPDAKVRPTTTVKADVITPNTPDAEARPTTTVKADVITPNALVEEVRPAITSPVQTAEPTPPSRPLSGPASAGAEPVASQPLETQSESFEQNFSNSSFGQAHREPDMNAAPEFAPVAAAGEAVPVAATEAAPVDAPAPLQPVRIMVPAVLLEQLDRVVLHAMRGDDKSMQIDLEPASLGRVHVHCRDTAQGLAVEIQVQSPAIRALLAGNETDLRTALDAQGVQLGRFSVSCGDEGQSGRKQFTENQSEDSNDRESAHRSSTTAEPVVTGRSYIPTGGRQRWTA